MTAYEKLEGQWLTSGDYVVFHRVAISESHLGKGLATKIVGFIETLRKQQHLQRKGRH
jgi:hypothetical protein